MDSLRDESAEQYTATLDGFRGLSDNWDSYGAGVIDPSAISMAEILMRSIVVGRATIVPTRMGGVQIEVHEGGYDVEIEINADGRSIDGYWASA